jgi:glycosyltransferase involved in cell wall biosynthesis
MTNLEWRKVEKTPEFPDGKAQYLPEPSKWVALELGCDPGRFGAHPSASDDDAFPVGPKIPGRVVHCSSPDRGLHHLLGAWPEIRRAVPHATLHVFYRLGPWLRGFDQTPYFPPIEPLRARANYVEECLRRFQELGGMGVTLRDAVSRETIEREMAQAEVSANPCDTTTWSEGFSCAILEACAARACPIISDCDALGEVYATLSPVPREPGWVKAWTARVIVALTTPAVRDEQNERAYKLASKLTWKVYAEKLMKEVESRR